MQAGPDGKTAKWLLADFCLAADEGPVAHETVNFLHRLQEK